MRAEYVDDVPYVRHYVPDLSPVRLRQIAALGGLTPPPDFEFDYCELGCGHGDTLAALGAAHPDARFVGIDISASHVASAKRLVRDGALENVGVLERDFGGLASEDIGSFDYITAHGVLTWVSPEKRKGLIALAGAKLKPGGLLSVSYNALPGWSSLEPLRQLLLFGGGSATGLERARLGVEFAQKMKRAGAGYFVRNPAAGEMLERMTSIGLPYVVHEYMHEHWVPLYFARVAFEMAEQDLHFVGTLPAFSNFRDCALPELHEKLLSTVTDRTTFESLKDFALDESFRRDVYVKGPASRSTEATEAYLDHTIWAMLAETVPTDRVVRLAQRSVSLEGERFDTFFEALALGAAPLGVLSERTGLPLTELRETLLRLVAADQVLPLVQPTRPVTRVDRYTVPSVYNQTMLRRLGSDTPVVMTSTIAGAAFPISALDGLAIRAITEVGADARERWVDDLVSRNVLRIRVGERVLAEEGEQRAAIHAAIEQVRARGLAKLVELGVLEPVTGP